MPSEEDFYADASPYRPEALVASLQAVNKDLLERLVEIYMIIPGPCPPGTEFTDAFKIKCFDELRARLYARRVTAPKG